MPHFTTSDNCKIYYKTYDFDTVKPTVIFLNGTAQTAVYWEAHRKVFRKYFRLLMYDARAQGRSDLGKQKLSLESHVRDLNELLDHLDTGQSHLIGLSHGAHVALAFAAQNREHVNRLVLCSLAARPSDRSKAIVQSWLEILKKRGLEAMVRATLPIVFGENYLVRNKNIQEKMVKAMVARNKRAALIGHFEAFSRYPPPLRLVKENAPPTLVISGSEDSLISKENAKALAEAVNGRHAEICGIGHTVPAEASQIFDRIALEFLLS